MKAFSWVAEEATILCFKHYDLAGIQDFKVEFFGHVLIVRLHELNYESDHITTLKCKRLIVDFRKAINCNEIVLVVLPDIVLDIKENIVQPYCHKCFSQYHACKIA